MSLLRRQRDLYRRLHRLAECQRGLVAENDSGPLLSLLGDRQKVIRSLLEVGQELAPHREDWPRTRDTLAAGDRQEAEQILAEVSTILGQVIAADEQDSRLLSARKVQTAQALQGVHSDRAAVSAYAAASSSAGPPLNRISEES
jgi:hypothetical protein